MPPRKSWRSLIRRFLRQNPLARPRQSHSCTWRQLACLEYLPNASVDDSKWRTRPVPPPRRTRRIPMLANREKTNGRLVNEALSRCVFDRNRGDIPALTGSVAKNVSWHTDIHRDISAVPVRVAVAENVCARKIGFVLSKIDVGLRFCSSYLFRRLDEQRCVYRSRQDKWRRSRAIS
jgi:hypothetical protein